jgi:hypothetical protein
VAAVRATHVLAVRTKSKQDKTYLAGGLAAARSDPGGDQGRADAGRSRQADLGQHRRPQPRHKHGTGRQAVSGRRGGRGRIAPAVVAVVIARGS